MAIKLTLTLMVPIFIGGCATGQGQINSTPEVVNTSDSAQIFVKRDSAIMGSAQTLIFTINGEDIYRFRNGDEFNFSLDPGEYLFGVACEGGWQFTGNFSEITQNITTRKKYMFRLIPDMNRGCRIERSSFR